jgi:hypothetical protein
MLENFLGQKLTSYKIFNRTMNWGRTNFFVFAYAIGIAIRWRSCRLCYAEFNDGQAGFGRVKSFSGEVQPQYS